VILGRGKRPGISVLGFAMLQNVVERQLNKEPIAKVQSECGSEARTLG